MKESVTRSEEQAPGSTTIEVHPGDGRLPALPHCVRLGAGITMTVDLAEPCPWGTLTFPPDSDAARSVVATILGHRALCADGTATAADPDSRPARALLRVAVVDALDRWLPVPVNQSLLDAERATARLHAATSLAGGPLPRDLLDTALALGRRAAPGVVLAVEALGRRAAVTPDLRDGVDGLVAGYAGLSGLVDGPDNELTSVGEAWAEHRPHLPVSDRSGALSATPTPDLAGEPAGPGRGVVDPRQSWARTFRLCSDPDRTEVAVVANADSDSVTVRVPAFREWVPRDVLSRLMVRLVDRSSGEVGGHALLAPTGRPLPPGTHAELTATVPLYGVDADTVRADLFDALVVGPPPAAADDDAGLRAARIAVVGLGRQRCEQALTGPDDARRPTVAELAAADGGVHC